ncbi:hypothetical protein EMCRGX_G018610 [Ephydatia muelleri]
MSMFGGRKRKKPQPADIIKDALLHGFWICCKYLIVTDGPCDGLSGLTVYDFDWMMMYFTLPDLTCSLIFQLQLKLTLFENKEAFVLLTTSEVVAINGAMKLRVKVPEKGRAA